MTKAAQVPGQAQTSPGPQAESEDDPEARAAAAAVAAQDDGPAKPLSTAEIVAESEPAVALVKGKSSSGTGFLAGPRLLATNSHVIDEEFATDLEIRFVSADDAHKAPLKAQLLYEDPERDLALLAVDTDLKPLRVAKTYTFRKGEDITVIGNPGLGDGQVLENAISRGVMSTKTRLGDQEYYQLGIAINPGNSGGPVFDSSGRVIGVATLKSSKQEATGFSIPIEGLQAALAKLAGESSSDAERHRSRHRINAAFKMLGSGGAVMCLIIDLRRAGASAANTAARELLEKLEPVVAEMDRDAFPSVSKQAPRIENDPLVARTVRGKVGELTRNFEAIRTAYAARGGVDSGRLRTWKQTHKRLLAELGAALKLEVPAGMLTAFDDHAPAKPPVIVLNPQGLGSYNSRLRPRTPIGPQHGLTRPPGGVPRPPSLRDRTRRGGLR